MEFFSATNSIEFASRFDALRETLALSRLSVPEKPLGDTGEARQLVGRLLGSPLPDAIMCARDSDALELMDAFAEHGVGIPG